MASVAGGSWERVESVQKLREYLGVEKGEYEKYANFKARVLEISRIQISERTDISFCYEEEKTGRRVSHIRFIVSPNAENVREPPQSTDTEEPATLESPHIARLTAYKVAEATARRLVAEHSAEVVGYNLGVVDRDQRRGGTHKIKDPAAYLVHAISNDIGGQLAIPEAPHGKLPTNDEWEEREFFTLQTAYRMHQEKMLKLYFGQASKEEMEKYKKEFSEHLKTVEKVDVIRDKFTGGETWFLRIICGHAVRFMLENCQDFQMMMIPFSQFAESRGVTNFDELHAKYGKSKGNG
jgi:hypothetical protein